MDLIAAARVEPEQGVVRGEVFRLPLPRGTRGAEQQGARFAVVVRADELLALSTVLVSPASTSAPPRSFRPTIEIGGKPTRVLVEQTTAISPERLGDSVGRLSAAELRDLDAALLVVLGLRPRRSRSRRPRACPAFADAGPGHAAVSRVRAPPRSP